MSVNHRVMHFHRACFALSALFLGCFLGSEKDNDGLIGTWVYLDTTKLAGSPLYFKTYWEFWDSQSFRYRFVPMAKATIQYDGEWELIGDTIKVYPKQCLEVGNGASDSLFPSICPDSSWGSAKVYWDGIQVFDLDSFRNDKRYYRRL